MSYYIGATGEYIWEELLENTTSNVIIANHINFDAGPLTDAIQETITDALGTAVGELLSPITEVPSATGVGVVALTALGLLSYYKLNRTAVQDADSMVYSADYASVLTPGMFDDRVRIRYDSNQFSNAFYYDGGVKKGEILTSRLNLLPVDSNNIDIYTSTGKIGIGTATPATSLHTYHATNNILRLQTAPVDATTSIEFVRGSTTDPVWDYRLINDITGSFKIQYSTNTVVYGGTGSDLINVSPTNINLYKNTEITGNLGIGVNPVKTLHTFHETDNVLRLQTATNGKVSIEFVRGTDIDAYTDYRFLNNNGIFKFQYEDASTAYSETVSDIYAILPTKVSIYKNTEFGGNVGIGTTEHATYKLDVNGTSRFTGNVGIATTPHATYPLDVLGDVRATAFRGDGANITGLNQANLVLTTAKIYEKCEPKTFIINPSDKIDIPPVYSFNITAFDRLANTTATYLEAGKFTCTYEDRNGIYKFIPTYIPNVNSKVLLNYRVGDKITFKHTANTQFDYMETPAVRWARLSVFKMPSGTAWTSQGMELYMTSIFDWDSDLTTVVDWTSGSPVSYPRQTPVTMQLETGFKYFFVKWQRNNDPITFNSYITPATESSGMNIAYGGGQGFKISGDYSGSGGYKPISSMLPPLMTADTEGTARRGSRLTIDNGVLSADVPISSDLITVMKPEHFINNTGTNKIEISTAYVAPSATKLATLRNIAGVDFDGTTAINIPYFNLTNKITVGTGLAITAGSATTSPNITISLAPSATKLATARAIAGVDFDGTTAINIPYFNLTNKITVGTGLAITAGSATTSPNITISLAPSATKLATARAIAGVDFDGTTAINIPYFNLTNKITVGSGLAITAGSATVSPDITLSLAEANIPTLSIGKISGLQGALDGKAPTSHTHAITDITGLQGALDGKAPTSHTHAITDITNLQGALDSKQATLSPGGGITIVGTTISAPAGTTTWLVSAGTPLTKVYYNAGNVGIGTTDPQYNLDIQGGTPVSLHMLSTAQGSTYIRYRENSINGFDAGYNGSGNRYVIYGYDNVATAVEYLSISRAGGRFGIGGIPTLLSRMKVYGILSDTSIAEFTTSTGAQGMNINPTAIVATGTDANISITLASKGTGVTTLNTNGVIRLSISGTGAVSIGGTLSAGATTITGNSSVIGNLVIGSATSQLNHTNNSIVAQGSDANIPLSLQTKGTSSFNILTGATPTTRLSISELGSVTIGGGISSGSITSSGTVSVGPVAAFTRISAGSIFVAGNDVTIPLAISAKGLGSITFTTNTTTRLTISGSTGNAIFANDISVAGLSTLTGRVGIGKAPHATYACDVLGDVNISGTFRIGGIPISSTASVWTTSGVNIYNNNTGNVGIGTNDPGVYKLNVNGGNTRMSGELKVEGGKLIINGVSPTIYFRDSNEKQGMIHINGNTMYFLSGPATNTSDGLDDWALNNNEWPLTINLQNNNARFGADVNCASITSRGDKTVGGNSYQRNTYLYSGNESSAVALYFATPFTGSATMAKSMIMALPISSFSRHHLIFCLNTFADNSNTVSTSEEYFRLHADGYISCNAQLRVFNEIFGGFYSVSMTNTDYICVQGDYSGNNAYGTRWLRVAFGSFTAFHRCYTDDELYNNTTNEDIDIFKNNYMGRVVIATGKIKTDLTRMNDEERGDDKPEYVEPDKSKKQTPEWYNAMDKDGISIEDAIPVVALSRKKKDKRVFGVLGDPKRTTNNPNRLIVNSIGEGAICVSNTNGNIENGDYLQSSDLLGYGEKQDDDLLHNYTIGKATIDCNFELDSPYYQCHEIENGVRVAFIACSYHCG